MKKRPLRIFVLISLLVFGLTAVSWKQLRFFFLFTRYSLTADLSQEEIQSLFFRGYQSNSRILPLMVPYLKNDQLLSYFVAEMIKNHPGAIRIQPEARNKLLSRFSGSIFLDPPVGLNPAGEARRAVGVDMLFLNLIQDQSLNHYTFDVLTQSRYQPKIGSDLWAGMIFFLNWRKNFPLADRLLQWGKKKARFDQDEIKLLEQDYIRRKNAPQKLNETKTTTQSLLESVVEYTGFSGHDYILLIEEDICDQLHLPASWIFSDQFKSPKESKIGYSGGIDEYESCSLRLMSFFSGKGTIKVNPGARSEYRYRGGLEMKGDRLYILYFRYKAPTGEEKPVAGFSRRRRPLPVLQATGDLWKEVFYFVNTQSLAPYRTELFFRMEGVGSTWFDDIKLIELKSTGSKIKNETVIIR